MWRSRSSELHETYNDLQVGLSFFSVKTISSLWNLCGPQFLWTNLYDTACVCVWVLCIYDWSAQLVLGCLCLNMRDPQTQWIIGWSLIIMDIHGLSFLSWKLPCGRILHFQENPNPRSNIPNPSKHLQLESQHDAA
jgi:hypothetical protein